MSFSMTVKRGSHDMVATYDDGVLTGNDYFVARLLDEIKYREENKWNLGGYHYAPKGKYLADPVAVKLIAEAVYPDIAFYGDIPEPKPLPDGAV